MLSEWLGVLVGFLPLVLTALGIALIATGVRLLHSARRTTPLDEVLGQRGRFDWPRACVAIVLVLIGSVCAVVGVPDVLDVIFRPPSTEPAGSY